MTSHEAETTDAVPVRLTLRMAIAVGVFLVSVTAGASAWAFKIAGDSDNLPGLLEKRAKEVDARLAKISETLTDIKTNLAVEMRTNGVEFSALRARVQVVEDTVRAGILPRTSEKVEALAARILAVEKAVDDLRREVRGK